MVLQAQSTTKVYIRAEKTFIKRYTVERTSKTEIRQEERNEKEGKKKKKERKKEK